jgi:hypothetical protein
MPMTTLGANGILADILADTLYLALLYGYPSDTDTGSTLAEITGSGYVRKELTPASWSTISLGRATYDAALSWTITVTWTQVAYAYALCSAISGGNLVAYEYLTTPMAINAGSGGSTTLTMPVGSLSIEVN